MSHTSEEIKITWQSARDLLELCQEFKTQKNDSQEVDLHDAVKKVGQAFGIEDIDKYAKQKFKGAMESGLGEVFEKGDAKAIAGIFAGNCKPVMGAVYEFAKGGLKPEEFIAELNKVCFGSADKLQAALQKSLGVPDDVAQVLADKLGPYLVSVYCFAAAYKIYQKAASDAAEAKERRVEAERLSEEAVAQLRVEREALEGILSDYLLDRLLPFEEGVVAMDQAILEDNDDGFIAANAQLWELFGRQAQYKDASEFEELMLSDEHFRL